ncbi:MAG: hypothetical protein DCC55_10825 [Chloroflexi bacterium]|nr:MAG: hypothetical protein DCC55_10825 [Chloroflexota bacterium]
MPLLFAHNTLILDANCVIGLYASRYMAEILDAIPPTVTIAAYVADNETDWIYGPLDESGQQIREPIDLQPVLDAGLLHIVTVESEDEAEALVTFSAMIRDQGEAVTGAIALCRNWAIALDDKKARRLFTEYAGHLQLFYTLELVKHWVDTVSPSSSTITDMLRNIRSGARYTPHRHHPLYSWWHNFGGG